MGQRAAESDEVFVNFRVPKTQRVYRVVFRAHHGHVVRHRQHRGVILMHEAQAAVRLLFHIGVAAEAHVDRLVRFAVFPREAVTKPFVRQLDLVAVDDFLLEQAVLVADAAPVAGKPERRHGVDEAGRETAEAAVAKAGVRLLGKIARKAQIQRPQRFLHQILYAQIDQVCVQKAAQQEFDREIINLLRFLFLICFVRLDPLLGQQLPRRRRDGQINLVRRQFFDIAPEHDMRRLHESLFQLFHHLVKLGKARE